MIIFCIIMTIFSLAFAAAIIGVTLISLLELAGIIKKDRT